MKIKDIIRKIENDEKPPTLNEIREMCGLPRIEEKKIEKIKNKNFTRNQKQIASKINEIIDKLNKED